MNASPRYVPFLPSFIQIGAENGDQGKGCFIVFEDEQEEEEESSMQKVEVVDEVNLQDDDPNDASSEDCIFRPLCYPRQLLKCSKWVGYISLLSLIVNLFFVVFGSSQSVFNTLVELFLLLVELLSILALFHGVAHQSPNYLQPFMFFGLVWNMALFVLWLFCVIELLQRKQEFLQKIVENASHLSSIDQQADIYKTGIWLTIMLLFGLGLVIVLGFWFLNIVVLTYLHLKRCQQQWDVNQIEAEKALLAPHEQSHDPNNKNRLK